MSRFGTIGRVMSIFATAALSGSILALMLGEPSDGLSLKFAFVGYSYIDVWGQVLA